MATVLPRDVSAAAVKAGLAKSSITYLLEAVADGTTTALQAVPGMTDSILAAVGNAEKTAYSQSFRTVFLVSIGFGGLAIIAAVISVPIDDKLNNVVAAKLSGTGASREELPTNEREKD